MGPAQEGVERFQQGAIPVCGIEMFLTQAARQLYLFTGRHVSERVLASFVAGV